MPRESGEADGTKARSKLNVFLSFCILHGVSGGCRCRKIYVCEDASLLTANIPVRTCTVPGVIGELPIEKPNSVTSDRIL